MLQLVSLWPTPDYEQQRPQGQLRPQQQGASALRPGGYPISKECSKQHSGPCMAGSGKCYHCKEPGNISKECSKQHSGPCMAGSGKCYHCKEPGNISRDCHRGDRPQVIFCDAGRGCRSEHDITQRYSVLNSRRSRALSCYYLSVLELHASFPPPLKLQASSLVCSSGFPPTSSEQESSWLVESKRLMRRSRGRLGFVLVSSRALWSKEVVGLEKLTAPRLVCPLCATSVVADVGLVAHLTARSSRSLASKSVGVSV
ncbi:Gag polyprotein-like [Dorcoceras hygrometricum]|uniref:Gag polyprotein-like n=1 Tax=Dorcoceras hygrometricum TaxID=472368 RepID=A0A2Z7B656_9LAMI|nr:Gag polyprotein-like [Dorcoceras hygrometricum]